MEIHRTLVRREITETIIRREARRHRLRRILRGERKAVARAIKNVRSARRERRIDNIDGIQRRYNELGGSDLQELSLRIGALKPETCWNRAP